MKQQIFDILQSGWNSVEIPFFTSISELPACVERKPGIYQIKTTTPISALSICEKRSDKAHCKFKIKITESLKLKSLTIPEDLENGYVVYTGHQKYLRQRCKEHFIGSNGTGCLNLFEIEEFRNYKWWFEYLEVEKFVGFEDSKLFRTYLEQLHRANIGWPILCSQ
ncbi:hypothetical protein [Kaistella jeonii]|uniref:Uncharacterized protein n=1 Tax=Kaistella jeonii TaxID=266749 RepID=A0A0C1FBL6_9FLAO|nr:hypothetical protein [Kaistella jeonii]KIA90492.1 hypothetical protein OA86_00960 [Kaistella jeonii]SFB71945.1 hypothetical protein SAMN05421876_101339 [Kaistella jeonii]VEI94929.1 Uncharacterised protein [Kaistella jeonii]